ncbi:TetR/AcrR family transcriptional regulator [Bradyrhizobium sediminis]|uniref:TetR/AcrR family transcriptional regulator n=1 Tax=Bradyrhizobium sediminis TaxID=2840469 RepID=A0A975NI45_9BRAD|nr:TetR/AcrR family transcriptional regulator [Bradyrhizobium sediminis]QWG15260.1 TetR/AcrR family transcriptional regulator [Bradyrhizobium sediminis]
MTRTTDARQKALATAERLFRTQGYAATGLTQILEESGAPKGSFYFHFPDGKEQLAREVLEAYGARTEAGMRQLAGRCENDPDRFIRALCKGIAKEMEAADWGIGCAAQNLANELAPSNRDFADALAAVFAAWTAAIAEVFAASSSSGTAQRRAMALIAALEGARSLARAMRSAAPFDAVVAQFTHAK